MFLVTIMRAAICFSRYLF